jgi:hypothetical protein
METDATKNAAENAKRKNMPRGRPFTVGNAGGPGRPSSQARAEAEAAERQALERDLGRAPSASEKILIRQAAALAVGKPTAESARLLSRIIKQLGLAKPNGASARPRSASYYEQQLADEEAAEMAAGASQAAGSARVRPTRRRRTTP